MMCMVCTMCMVMCMMRMIRMLTCALLVRVTEAELRKYEDTLRQNGEFSEQALATNRRRMKVRPPARVCAQHAPARLVAGG